MRYVFADYTLDTDRRELRRGAAMVALEPKVFDLLAFLIAHREGVLSKEDLLASVWQGRIVSDSALSAAINGVRAAIGDNGKEQRLIKTLPRKGIRFIGAVREDGEACLPDNGRNIAGPVLALPDKPSIAVLPFNNMSDDSNQDYFADGMAEDIITALSRCSWLFVIARNSSFTYRGRPVDTRQIGRELGVRYVIEGSVRRGKNLLRVTAQLIDATSGVHIWADRFDADISEIFELQDRITEAIVTALQPSLLLAEIARLRRKSPIKFDAYDLLLRAQQLEYEYTAASLSSAIGNLKQALEIDRAYAPAMALCAYCFTERRQQGWAEDRASEGNEGSRLAFRAIELGRSDGNVLWMSAYALWNLTMDTWTATELANQSLVINPNCAMAMALLGWIEAGTSNSPSGLEHFRRALRLSPRDPRGWFITGGIAFSHLMEGQFIEAATFAENALLHNPRYAIALRVLAASLAKQGKSEKAASIIGRLLSIEPGLTLSDLRQRLMFMDDQIWGRYADGLRRAGLPE